MIPITDEEFESTVLSSDVPVLVEFWADWCQPCKRMAPIVESVEKELDGKVKFVSMDADNPKTSGTREKFGVQTVPTILVFNDSFLEGQMLGAIPKIKLLKSLTSLSTSVDT